MLEALTAGVPVVGWPLFAEQKINAMWFCDNGVGELIEGTGLQRQRLVPAAEIAEVIGKVAEKTGGENDVYRAAARKWGKILASAQEPEGSSSKDLKQLVEEF